MISAGLISTITFFKQTDGAIESLKNNINIALVGTFAKFYPHVLNKMKDDCTLNMSRSTYLYHCKYRLSFLIMMEHYVRLTM